MILDYKITSELLIIFELVVLLIAITAFSIAIYRAFKRQITELTDLNEAMLEQLNAMQSVLDEKHTAQQAITEEFEELGEAVDIQVNHTLEYANENITDMSRLVMEHMKLITETEYYLSQSEPDISSAKKEIKKLKELLGTTERNIIQNKNKLSSAEENIKTLKEKMRDLSKQIKTLNSIEVSESRLKRDKLRLTERIEKLNRKYETQKIKEKNLKDEIKTSFRASEVQYIKDELKETENKLKQALVEKAFIEQHFLELASYSNPEEIDNELRRVKREMKQLENGILDLQNDALHKQ